MFLKLCYLHIFSLHINNLNFDNVTPWFLELYQIKTVEGKSLNLKRISQPYKSRALFSCNYITNSFKSTNTTNG